jgi:hypothetical protein
MTDTVFVGRPYFNLGGPVENVGYLVILSAHYIVLSGSSVILEETELFWTTDSSDTTEIHNVRISDTDDNASVQAKIQTLIEAELSTTDLTFVFL